MIETGFVLLEKHDFDYQAVIIQLKMCWYLNPEGVEITDDVLVFAIGDVMCSIGLMPAPVPHGETVQRAQGNYYCQDAVDVAKAHKPTSS